MKLLAALLLFAACGDTPVPSRAKRDNRVIQYVALINPKAECYAVATPDISTPAPDTAYCAVGAEVFWCAAGLATPPECKKIGQRQLEQPEPEKIAPPTKAGDKIAPLTKAGKK